MKIAKSKYGGRTKNTPNKVTADVRQLIQSVVANQFVNIENDLKKMKPYHRLDVLIKLMNFIVPKQNNINTGEGEKIEFIITKGKTIL